MTTPDKAAEVATDVRTILAAFDKDNNGQLDAAEAKQLQARYTEIFATPAMMNKLTPEERNAFKILQQKYDTNRDGHLDFNELNVLHDDIKSTDTAARYVAYGARLTALWRYAAYTSDLGEAFRPVAHPWVVRGTYGVSWAYVLGDVAWEGKKDYDNGIRGNTLYQHVTKRATFQAVASMALPAFTIHSVVHFMKDHVFKNSSARLKAVGPTGAGLMCIPFLPLYDHPVEHATEWLFDTFWPVEEPAGHGHGHGHGNHH